MNIARLSLLLLSAVATARAEVVSSDFLAFPGDEGWTADGQFCDPEVAVDDGWYSQIVDFDACDPPDGGEDRWTRSIEQFNGERAFFLEFRLATNGNRSEIPGGAPAALAMANFFGISYNVTIARDQIKILRDVNLPILFVDVDPVLPHTVRLELHNEDEGTFNWLVDGGSVENGAAEGLFPSANSAISWRGKAWFLTNEIHWDYIRYGTIPEDASGDFDSDGDHDLRDYYHFFECLNTDVRPVMPDNAPDPGCLWADINADNHINLLDFANFQSAFTGE